MIRGHDSSSHSWMENWTMAVSVISRYWMGQHDNNEQGDDAPSSSSEPMISDESRWTNSEEEDHIQSLDPDSPAQEGAELEDPWILAHKNNLPPRSQAPIPLAYRYYRQLTYRQRSSGGPVIPFILLGPNVDHWKASAQELAAAGFSAIACEPVKDKENNGDPDSRRRRRSSNVVDATRYTNDDDEMETIQKSANAIVELLDALRWNRAVLVASDSECAMAIQAALQLAPDRILGKKTVLL